MKKGKTSETLRRINELRKKEADLLSDHSYLTNHSLPTNEVGNGSKWLKSTEVNNQPEDIIGPALDASSTEDDKQIFFESLKTLGQENYKALMNDLALSSSDDDLDSIQILHDFKIVNTAAIEESNANHPMPKKDLHDNLSENGQNEGYSLSFDSVSDLKDQKNNLSSNITTEMSILTDAKELDESLDEAQIESRSSNLT